MRLHVPAGIAAFALVITAASGTGAPGSTNPADAEALATVMAIDSAEVMMAELALSKKVNSGVKDLAQEIKDDHAADLKWAADLSKKINVTASSTPMVDSLKKKNMDQHHKLAALDSAEFDRAFLDAMIAGHEEASRTIDMLLTKTLNDDVKKHLTTLKESVGDHHKSAKALRDG